MSEKYYYFGRSGGSRVFMCFYDLQKAFDSVEYPALLERLFEMGVTGKTWRLLRSWYKGAFCKVECDGKTGLCSVTFAIPPCDGSIVEAAGDIRAWLISGSHFAFFRPKSGISPTP